MNAEGRTTRIPTLKLTELADGAHLALMDDDEHLALAVLAEVTARAAYLEHLLERTICVGFFASSPFAEVGMKYVSKLSYERKKDLAASMLKAVASGAGWGRLKKHGEWRNHIAHASLVEVRDGLLIVTGRRIQSGNDGTKTADRTHEVQLVELDSIYFEARDAVQRLSDAIAALVIEERDRGRQSQGRHSGAEKPLPAEVGTAPFNW